MISEEISVAELHRIEYLAQAKLTHAEERLRGYRECHKRIEVGVKKSIDEFHTLLSEIHKEQKQHKKWWEL